MRGEKRDANSLDGSVIETFGNKGDYLQYTFPEAAGEVIMRCRAAAGEEILLSAGGREIKITGTGNYELVPLGKLSGKVAIKTLSEGKLTMDSCDAGENAKLEPKKFAYRPKMDEGVNDYVLKYEDQPNYYGLAWNYEFSEVRLFDNSSLDVFMKTAVHRHPPKYFKGDQKGFYTSAFVRPVFLKPQTDTTVWFMLAQGEQGVVSKAMADFHADEKKVVDMEERLRKGKLNLEDFLEQMKQMKGMGSMEEIAGMIPGMSGKLKDATIDEKAMARTEAIILSMTPQERANPDLLNFSRKKRIAAGCGQRVEDINRLLKQFEMTQKMVKQMTGMTKRMGKKKGGFKFPF
jgi:hypothetical protein